jgi:methyl-accepting chemotaxis protein
MTAFLIIQSIVSVQNNAKLRALVEQAIEKNYQAVASINGLINDLEILRRYEKEYFIYIADVMKKGKYARQWQTTFEESQARLANMIRNPERVYNGEDVLRFSDWKQALQFYGEEFSQILVTYKNIRAGKQTDPLGEPLSIQANGKIHEGKSRLSKALQDATRMSKTKTEESLGIVGKVEDSFQMVKTVSLSLTLAAIVLSVILIFIVPGGISQTLNRLLNVAEQLSRGDLSKPVERSPVPEFDSLAQSLERIRITQLADSQRKGNRRRM